MRVLLSADPFPFAKSSRSRVWPANWIQCPNAPFAAYRREFRLKTAATIRFHVSADERYELFLDGRRLGRGPERGSPERWFYESYELCLPAGAHTFLAKVWALGHRAPVAQMTVEPGFILCAEGRYGKLLNTGVAAWQTQPLTGYTVKLSSAHEVPAYYACGGDFVIDTRVPESAWQPARAGTAGGDPLRPWGQRVPNRVMVPAALPAMLEVPGNNLIRPTVIPANSSRRLLIDLKNYFCAYPEVVVTGGRDSQISVGWAEALFTKCSEGAKGNRNSQTGKFYGPRDRFIADGKRQRFDTPWWRCGRFVELSIQTGDEPLRVESFRLRETRYPLEPASEFRGERRLERAAPLMVRALQMCAHETYMDCPYYEQLMYVGDTRLQVLATYTLTHDDRLPRKAIQLFDASRVSTGWTQSRFPAREVQIIPTFSLWWVTMVHDFARWRDDEAFVRARMPGVRTVLETMLSYRNSRGLIEAPVGWNFIDWVPAWKNGLPPGAIHGVSGPVNWLTVLALQHAADLERWLGEPESAARYQRLAAELSDRIAAAFWNQRRHQFADDLAHRHYSEHSQCLAILSGRTARLTGRDLAQTTIYFSHYLFETLRQLEQPAAILKRMQLWFDLEKHGFKTTPERPEPSRSDCHGWGAHPLYHYHATFAGIRPAGFGFREIEIRPLLPTVSSRLPHPRGWIKLDVRGKQARVALPRGTTGRFIWKGQEFPLRGGRSIKLQLR